MPSLWVLAPVPFPFLVPFCFHSRLLRFVFRIAYCSRRCHQRQNEGRPRTNTDTSSDTQERPVLNVGLIAFGHQCVSAPLHLVSLHCAAVTFCPRLGAVTFWRQYILALRSGHRRHRGRAEATKVSTKRARKRPLAVQRAPEATIDCMNNGWKPPRRR